MSEPTKPPAVDIRALAEKVYRLLLEDIRLEQRRTGRNQAGKKR